MEVGGQRSEGWDFGFSLCTALPSTLVLDFRRQGRKEGDSDRRTRS